MEERLKSNELTSKTINELLKVDYIAPFEIKKFESEDISQVAQNSFEVIEAIKNTNLITDEDAQKVKKAQEFLVSGYKDVIIYNPRIVKVASILSDGKFATNDAKYWQCKMQAETHFNEFIRSLYKLDRVRIDLEEIQYQISTLTDMINNDGKYKEHNLDVIKLSFDRRRLVNKLNQYVHEMKLLEKDIKQRLREVNDWVEIAEGIKPGCIHSTSDYEEHTINAHKLALENWVKSAKTPEERKNFTDQLNTFMRLLKAP